MITNDNLTLYNKVSGQDGAALKRTHIYGVAWQDIKKASVGETGLETAVSSSEQSAKVFVPMTSIDSCGKQYQSPKLYEKAQDKAKIFTIKKGDIVARGIIEEELSETDLRKQYDDVMTITSIKARDFGSYNMQHFELGVV